VPSRAVIAAGTVTSLVVGSGVAAAAITPLDDAEVTKVLDRTLVCSTGEGGPEIEGGPKTAHHPGGFSLVRRYTGGRTELVGAGTTAAYVDTKYCAPTTNKVPLTRKGLPGPPVLSGKCPLGRVLVRLRYTYTSTNAEPPPYRYTVFGRLISAYLAVRSYRTPKPLAFAKFTEGGREFELYTAPSCVR
jgi:hypothetical protein